MTVDEFRLKFETFKVEAYNYIRSQAPYRTGTLKSNIKFVQENDGFSIVIDIWYMVYTEMKWTFNRRWKKVLINPNEAWFQQAVETLTQISANLVKGVVVRVN